MSIIIKNGMHKNIYFVTDPIVENGSGVLEPGQKSGELAPDINISYIDEVDGRYMPEISVFGTFSPKDFSRYGNFFTITGGITVSRLED